jgi:chromosomal replication initiator protein
MARGGGMGGVGVMAVEAGMNARQVWQAVLGDLQVQVSLPIYDTWLKTTTIVDFADGRVVVGAPNTFAVEQLRSRFTGLIQRALATILGYEVAVDFAVFGEEEDEEPVEAPRRPVGRSRVPGAPAMQPGQQLALEETPAHGLNSEYVFETFIVGKSNQFAHAACLSVANKPGQKFNPLFLYGDVGLGKTHLLHAAGHHARQLFDGFRVLYASSETFTNDVITAILKQRTDELRDRYRTIDMLLIDDIQFIAGKESTQEEFFHTFNALHQAGKQIIVSSDRPPKQVPTLADRLRSRFEGGLIADVQLPDYEMRIAILRMKAEELNLDLPADVAEYIAQKDQKNIRELEGALNTVVARSQLTGEPMTLALAMEALLEGGPMRRTRVTRDEVIGAVLRHFGVDRRELAGRSRTKDIVLPRQVAMYLLRAETDASLLEIGSELGGRDHTTVLHGIKQIERSLGSDASLRAQVLAIKESLVAGHAS